MPSPERRKFLIAEYGTLYAQVSEILFRHDLIGINFEVNTDEYEPEVALILPGLRNCQSARDAQMLVHRIFQDMFDPGTAGPIMQYMSCSEEIWQAWLKAKDSIAPSSTISLGSSR